MADGDDIAEKESSDQQIVLSEILRRLVDQRPGVKRRQVAKELDVSEGALSKYITGRDTPRLTTLVSIAQHFDVSLDYLVLGKTPRVNADASRVADVENRLDVLIRLERTRQEILARFSDRMSSYAAEVFVDITKGPVWPGVFSATELAAIEGHAKHVDLVVPYLDEDLGPDGKAGPLMLKTAANINRGIDYRVLVDVRTDKPWAELIPAYRETLHHHCQCPYDLIDTHFKVRLLNKTVFAGFALYWLDARDYPASKTAERGEPDGQGHYLFAILQPGHLDSDAHSVLRPEHARAALAFFEEWWNDPTTVPV